MGRVLPLVAALLLAGCVAPGTVRTALLVETIALDERAPPEAHAALTLTSCGPGTYDAAARRLVLEPSPFSDTTPRFVVVWQRGETPWPMTAGSGGGFLSSTPLGVWLEERGSSGSWGHGIPYASETHTTLAWDRHGARLDGEPLAIGTNVTRTIDHEVTQFNATFGVTQTLTATYLGRLPYEIRATCHATGSAS